MRIGSAQARMRRIQPCGPDRPVVTGTQQGRTGANRNSALHVVQKSVPTVSHLRQNQPSSPALPVGLATTVFGSMVALAVGFNPLVAGLGLGLCAMLAVYFYRALDASSSR